MGPGGVAKFRGQRLKIFKVESINEASSKPGLLEDVNEEYLTVGCGEGVLKVKQVQPESKARMAVSDFVRGYQVKQGDRFE